MITCILQGDAVDTNNVTYGDTTEVQEDNHYFLRVPDVSGASWRVNYDFHWNQYHTFEEWQLDAVGTGYYSSEGTTWNQTEATLLEGGQNYSETNVTYLMGNTISGTISFPDSSLTNYYHHVEISAEEENSQCPAIISKRFIDDATNTIKYQLTVPDSSSSSWRIKVDSNFPSPYIQDFYYATDGTTWNPFKATLLKGGQKYSGIDLILFFEEPVYDVPFLPGVLNMHLLNNKR